VKIRKIPLYALFVAFFALLQSEIGAQGLANSIGGLSATPTQPSPASSFWNPALLGACPRTQIETNLALVGGWLIYDRAGRDPNTQTTYPSTSTTGLAPNPFFAISSPLNSENFRFGYSTYFPSGAFADFDESGSQRYELIKGYMIPWHHQFTIAYRPSPEFSIGFSGIYSAAFFKTELDVDLSHFANQGLNISSTPAENQSLSWRARVPFSTAHSLGAGLGILYWPTFQWSFGFSVYTPMTYEFTGPLNLDTQGSLTEKLTALRALGVDESIRNEVEAKSTIPWVFQGGFRYQPFGYWTMEYFGRYSLSSMNRSLGLKFKDSSIQGLKGLNIQGRKQDDTYLSHPLTSTQTLLKGK
jgi:long-subunit fatty acid transport protein